MEAYFLTIGENLGLLFFQALFRAVGMDAEDFKFGMTKVFFRPGKVISSLFCRALGYPGETRARVVFILKRMKTKCFGYTVRN